MKTITFSAIAVLVTLSATSAFANYRQDEIDRGRAPADNSTQAQMTTAPVAASYSTDLDAPGSWIGMNASSKRN